MTKQDAQQLQVKVRGLTFYDRPDAVTLSRYFDDAEQLANAMREHAPEEIHNLQGDFVQLAESRLQLNSGIAKKPVPALQPIFREAKDDLISIIDGLLQFADKNALWERIDPLCFRIQFPVGGDLHTAWVRHARVDGVPTYKIAVVGGRRFDLTFKDGHWQSLGIVEPSYDIHEHLAHVILQYKRSSPEAHQIMEMHTDLGLDYEHPWPKTPEQGNLTA